MALSLDGMGVGGGVVLSLAVPSIAAANFAGAGTPAEREAQVQVREGSRAHESASKATESHGNPTAYCATAAG